MAMRWMVIPVVLFASGLPARAEPCDDVPPSQPGKVRVELVAREQIACRKPVEGFAGAGLRTVADAVDGSSANSAAVDGSGEVAVNLASGFQLRAGGDVTLGSGPSAEPSGGARLAAATPPGILTTEVEQRVELHRLPALFANRMRAPGQRYDEVATVVRTSAGSGDNGKQRAMLLPITVERSATYAEQDLTRWSLRVGMFAAGGKTATVDVLDFRSEWIAGESLHHIDLFDARVHDGNAHGRIRIGAADDAPTTGGETASSLSYRTWEGELSLGGRNGDRGLDAGFRSDCMLTTDGKLAREHRLHGGVEHALSGGWIGIAGFLARTHLGEVDQVQMPRASVWTYGATGTYTRRVRAVEIAALVAAGRTFHRRIGEVAVLEPGFAATLSLSITAIAGDRPVHNRMPD